MGAQENTRSEQVLAGKRSERVVMRNRVEGYRPLRRGADGTADISGCQEISVGATTDLTPEEARILSQRFQALDDANLVRMERATTRMLLRRGQLDWDDFLDETPECCLKVQVGKALTWLPHIGRERAERILTAVPDTNFGTRLCDLSFKAKYALSHQVTAFYVRNRTRRPRAA